MTLVIPVSINLIGSFGLVSMGGNTDFVESQVKQKEKKGYFIRGENLWTFQMTRNSPLVLARGREECGHDTFFPLLRFFLFSSVVN